MPSPNFFLVGAPKAGTTALWNYLRQHPSIYMSPVKEPHFYVREEVEEGYRGPFDSHVRSLVVNDPLEYRSLFDGVRNETVIGEASISYLYSNRVPIRLREQVPNCKLLAILRDPVDRAYSQHRFNVAQGWEPVRSFKEALAREDERVTQGWSPPFHYLRRGFYARQLEHYSDWFDSGRILVLLNDDLLRKPARSLETVFEFLDVDPNFAPEVSKPHNVSSGRSRAVEALLVRQDGVLALKSLVPQKVRAHLSRRLWLLNRQLPAVPAALREQLVDRFRPDIEKLQILLGRDLGDWLLSG